MNGWEAAALVVGVLIELGGIVLTGFGLYTTWLDHAGGEPFGPAAREEVRALFARLRPGRPVTHQFIATGAGQLHLSDSVHVVRTTDPNATLEEQVAALRDDLRALSSEVSRTTGEVHQLGRRLDRTTEALDERITELTSDVTSRLREQTLRGLPLAVVGLALTGVGTVIQLVASLSAS